MRRATPLGAATLLVAVTLSAGTVSAGLPTDSTSLAPVPRRAEWPATSRIIYVHAGATGAGTGLSWDDAFVDLQDALDHARATGCAAPTPCEVWVAQGVYTADRGTGDRTFAFELASGISIYGGFAGDEMLREQRDVTSHPTVLSGDLNGDDADVVEPLRDCCMDHEGPGCGDPTCEAAVAGVEPSCVENRWRPTCAYLAALYCCDLCRPTHCDNTHNVVRVISADDEIVLDGLTIAAGEANGADLPPDPRFGASPYASGGGLLVHESDPLVHNCVFRGNAGSTGTAAYLWSGHLTMTDTLIADNTSYGGLSGEALDSSFSTSIGLESCTFLRNRGGGAHIEEGNRAIRNCAFIANSSRGQGGGLSLTSVNFPNVVNCLFLNNEAGSGGGLYSGYSARLTNCTFLGNHVWGEGGAIQSVGSIILRGSLIHGNWAGGLRPWYPYGSTDGIAGGISGGMGATVIENCTITHNSAGSVGGVGIASPASIRGVLLRGNYITEPSSNPYHQSSQIYGSGSATIDIAYSMVQNWNGSLGGVGNSGDDPLFVDPDGEDDIIGTEDDDLRLSPDSPAINAGDPDAASYLSGPDLDGHERFLCDRVDTGAYEFGIGDIDCNRVVNLADFAAWPFCTAHPDAGLAEIGCRSFDFNADGSIDVRDFAGFQRAFGP